MNRPTEKRPFSVNCQWYGMVPYQNTRKRSLLLLCNDINTKDHGEHRLSLPLEASVLRTSDYHLTLTMNECQYPHLKYSLVRIDSVIYSFYFWYRCCFNFCFPHTHVVKVYQDASFSLADHATSMECGKKRLSSRSNSNCKGGATKVASSNEWLRVTLVVGNVVRETA